MLTILGGGPAGLAAAYFARQRGLSFALFEAASEVGGNCRTLRHGDFLFDTGAHRFHERDADMAGEMRKLLGADLLRTDVPSQVVFDGTRVDFPLSPLNLARNLGPRMLTRAATDFIKSRSSRLGVTPSFENVAVHRYGRTIAKLFLLDYTEKLWGTSPATLSPLISGQRLQGLRLKTFLLETLRGSARKTEHLDGSFLYPRFGIGMIPSRMADACGREHVHLNARVTRLFHAAGRITEIEINGHERQSVEHVVSSLPLPIFVRALDPPAPPAALAAADCLRFQNVLLIVLFLRIPRVTNAATLYFPSQQVPFTRISEPKNRSTAMSPADQTSLMIEVPCSAQSDWWTSDVALLVQQITECLEAEGVIRASDVTDFAVHRIPFAYPILEMGTEKIVRQLLDDCRRFANLTLTGRGGLFAYNHVHDLLRAGHDAIETLASRR